MAWFLALQGTPHESLTYELHKSANVERIAHEMSTSATIDRAVAIPAIFHNRPDPVKLYVRPAAWGAWAFSACDRCFPTDRYTSLWACRWVRTAVPPRGAQMTACPGRWFARIGPLSGAGPCRSSPDRQSETTPPDRDRRPMMGSDGSRVGSLLPQGLDPMLGSPAAGVGRIDPDHVDAPAGRHANQPSAELGGRDTGHGAPQPFSALSPP